MGLHYPKISFDARALLCEYLHQSRESRLPLLQNLEAQKHMILICSGPEILAKVFNGIGDRYHGGFWAAQPTLKVKFRVSCDPGHLMIRGVDLHLAVLLEVSFDPAQLTSQLNENISTRQRIARVVH